MRILALDSSGLVASVAVLEDDILIAEYTINYKKTHSQTLVPMLNEIKEMTELDLGTIDAIAVSAGPGSFTGLRIGSATAKGLGLALKKPIVSIPTVDGLAYNLYGAQALVCPIMDARRNQVYTGIYEFVRKNNSTKTDSYEMKTLQPQCAVDFATVATQLNELNREVIFLGDGVPVFQEQMKDLLKIPYSFAPAMMNRQCAATVAALAKIYYEEGKLQTAMEHEPEYLRLSQAERERKEAKNDN